MTQKIKKKNKLIIFGVAEKPKDSIGTIFFWNWSATLGDR